MYYGSEFSVQTLLRPVMVSDAEFILSARMNEQRNRFLSAVTGDLAGQIRWVEKYLERNRRNEEYYFVVEDPDHNPHGLIRLYNINYDTKKYVIGSWLLLPDAPLLMAQESIALAYNYAFNELNLQQCNFEVMKNNKKVLRFHRFYAQEISSDDVFIYFKFLKEDFDRSLFQQFLQKR